MKTKLILALSLCLFAFSVNAQSVLGKWKTFDDKTGEAKSIVEITERKGKLYGKVVQLLNPKMQDAKCKDCPDGKAGKPIIGTEVLYNLTKSGDKYDGGKILDPASGKVYKCNIQLGDKNTLNVRGYVGFSLIGRTQTWKRVTE